MEPERHELETLAAVNDPVARSTLRLVFHFRRYLLLYVVGIVAALVLLLLPSVEGGGGATALGGAPTVAAGSGATGAPTAAAGAVGTPAAGTATLPAGGAGAAGGAALPAAGAAPSAPVALASTPVGGGTSAPAPTAAAGSAAGTTRASPGSSGGRVSGRAVAASAASGRIVAPQVGTGTTVGGFHCAPGVGQLPYSQYAAPCEARYTGGNGGATTPGVTAKTITMAVRVSSDAGGANALEVEAEAQAAGGVTYTQNWDFIQTLTNYFNKTFDLYGRKVVWTQYNGEGSDTDEALGEDQAGACADADEAATSLHAFGIVDYEGVIESEPLSACAARYHLYAPEGAAYFPESYFQAWNPYVWTVTMNCTTISQGVDSYVASQLYPYPAKWAGLDGLIQLNGRHRKFGIYVPNNAGYQSCVNYASQLDTQQYHESPSYFDQYNYALDVATFPQDAQNAIIKFAADQDTTIILACDPLSPIFMTQDAAVQNYHPEWMLEGVALTDDDNLAQLWDQSEINGHLFGLSQAGDEAAALAPSGEVAQAWKDATGQSSLQNPEISLDYELLVAMFDQLQAAGPDLTPQSLAAGTHTLPVLGGPAAIFGTWDWQTLHTAIINSREVYWDGGETSPADGKQGTYLAIYDGKRFQAGQFPSGEPPYYP